MTVIQRQSELISAALTCLKKEGYKGLSVRKIADEAKVSVGLINHHFGSLEKLISAAYESMAGGILICLKETCEGEITDPAKRIEIFIRESFNSSILDPDLLNAWIVFWGMTRYSPEIDKSHSLTYTSYLEFLSQLLGDLWRQDNSTECNIRLASISFSSMLDGLWVESCLNSHAFKPEDAVSICQAWIKGFRAGMFAS
ncbi:TetR/AcrR family transcriptional regulator [Erwinia sp. S38]|uniref:TetR/AcrR family transcriptional regulator n=1 Tax=Erwinia sp. S38 TaxID=2769338 RepID=UPI00190A4D04|nr:TetR/AcrR family transcriptional regulator [Erwinia sp. S38]MBK0003332.1 TetR family transcriptional regulator C-terminal domain-containing protein [Erwinia sp. S38]